MSYILYILFYLLFGFSCASTITSYPKLKSVASLPEELDESSGMETLDNDLYVGNNDSGNPAELYVFSLKKKTATRTVKVKGADNHDWEELAADERYLYIGDTGNNAGTRKDLTIYKVSKDQLREQNEVDAQKITFHYPNQKSFKPSNENNFDCEAFVVVGDSLYLFSKNRGNTHTDLYSIPNMPGNYKARQLGKFDAQGLITGADFRTTGETNELVLVGYMVKSKGYHPFLLYFSGVMGTRFFEAPVKRFIFEGRMQTETVLFHDDRHVYISNEEEHGDQGFIYQVDIKN